MGNRRYKIPIFTEEEIRERKQKRLDSLKSTPVEYSLGFFIGEYILHTKLPTLDIDILTTRNIIPTSQEERDKCKKLDEAWFDKVSENSLLKEEEIREMTKKEWEDLQEFRDQVEKKYLPEKLECYVPPFYTENMNLVKEGIMNSLWGCDCSHYKCSDIEDIEIDFDFGYLFSKITLTRG
jgi:hypothetical protein